jgi:N-acylneuraminate cytidylyltransferase/CMP-N,N'-diacetyllegionaminic acid synthase
MCQVEVFRKYYRRGESEVLAVIPARMGSRRVPRKNVKPLGGKPLIVWTFECAKKAESLNRIVVSTDDPEVKDLALKYGIEVPYFPRKKELCEDVDTTLVILDIVKFLEEKEGYRPSHIVTLQCTTPFRLPTDINECVDLALTTKADTILTVRKITERPEWMLIYDINRRYVSSYFNVDLAGNVLVSQSLPTLHYPAGSIYVNTYDLIMKERMFGKRMAAIEVPIERAIDIEEEVDFIIAEALLQKYGKEWGLI